MLKIDKLREDLSAIGKQNLANVIQTINPNDVFDFNICCLCPHHPDSIFDLAICYKKDICYQ